MTTARLLGRALLEGAEACLRRGVSINFDSMQALCDHNTANSDSWRPLLPIFSPYCHDFKPGTTLCMLGRDDKGDVVLAQAARLFDWRGTSFHEEAESLRLFYEDPRDWKWNQRGEQARIVVTAPMAREITGIVAYTGAHWVRPDFRGRGLTGITPRMARALAVTAWDVPMTCTIMAKDIFDRGVTERAGYPHHEWTVDLQNTTTGTFPAALLWATRDEIIADLEQWLAWEGA